MEQSGLFAQNPSRAPIGAGLTARATQPPDYETPVAFLDSFITPNERFFVRCHLPVPAVLDAASWTLKVDGSVNTPVTLSLDDLIMTQFLAGGDAQTLPMLVYSSVRLGVSPQINVLATIIVVIAATALLVSGRLARRR